MNCIVCSHYGKCKVWADEIKFFDSFPNKLPHMNYSRIFTVTEQGAYCQFFKENKEDRECANCRHSEFLSVTGQLYCHIHKRTVGENVCDKWGMRYD